MKRFLLSSLLLLSLSSLSFAQPSQTPKELYEAAKAYTRQGDYDNATLVFKRLLEQDPNNADVLKDYAFLCYLKRDYVTSIQIGKSLTEKPDADVQSFQVLGMAYKGIAETKECAKLYKKAIAKFPKSGVIYNDYGELLAGDKDMGGAIAQWEAGIKADAGYSSNYYNASAYYAQNGNLFWTIIYGEVFVNLESYTQRTADVKALLLDAWKKVYTTTSFPNMINKKGITSFEKTFFETLSKSNSLAAQGITPETLSAIKTRFILDWFHDANNEKYPFHLFEHEQYLLREGMFDAYNEWLFGTAASPSAYQVWLDNHDAEASRFKQFQQSRVFKLPAGQYYHDK